MGKKKKSGNKLGKMSEEERVLYLEQQRLAEEELKKKKEDVLMQFLKDKLSKEEKATRFNMNKLNHQWRNIMRESKAKELKKDIEILSQTFERVVDRKDSIIKSLVKDLLESEEQYFMALRSHLQNVDQLVDLQKQRLSQLELEFETEQDVLIVEFDTEREMLVRQNQKELTELQDIIFAMEQEFAERENEAKNEFQSIRDELKNKNLEEKHALRVQLETAVEDLWAQFQSALRNYQETTEERKKAFEELKAKDEKSAKEIEMQMRKLQRISDNIAQLKAKMASNSKEGDERNKQLREEREMMIAHFQGLKGEMNRLREIQRAQLTKLTLETNAAVKELQRKCRKGEMILRLAERARRFETEEEKVLPFYASSLTSEEAANVTAAIEDPPTHKLAEVMYEYQGLENFWKRYNRVLLDRVALDKEKSDLMHENQQLRTLLKQYLDGISVNDEILNQVNPLFVVNHRTNVNIRLNVPVTDPRIQRPQQQMMHDVSRPPNRAT
ncbi:hypothetical protein NP493_892g03010 [Ridgeia piscesae]|uniref:Dynein regulatory complex subunit 2 n=1 Tax=Ridgeia piscesae TaxID=27915 RepID=A0AAD9KL68_RIDPI|nr:hypothetical protein NP493_892g03010 [Ridgeia piscesae]